MDSVYYHKYKKYKNKYLQLKGGNNNFYFIHGTKNINTLLSILKEGIIKPGKDIPEQYRKLSGGQALDYIYGHIYFENLNNLTHYPDFTLIINPKIIGELDIVFNKGWTVKPDNNSIFLYKTDNTNVINEKLNQIKNFLKDPQLPKKVKEFSPFYHHEMLFTDNIHLKNNLLGIVCNDCEKDKNFNKIKKIIDEKYPGTKLYNKNYPFHNL